MGALTGVRPGPAGAQEPFGEQRQQGRFRAAAQPDRGVRGGARARGDVQPGAVRVARAGVGGVAVQALGTPGVEVAVRRRCAPLTGRHTWPPWVWPAKVGVVAVARRTGPARAGTARARRRRQARRLGRRRPGDRGEVVVLQVRVVHADEARCVVSPTSSRPERVGQVGPAALVEGRRAGPARAAWPCAMLRLPSSGSRYHSGLRSGGREVVVGTEDEHSRRVEQRPEPLDQGPDRVLVREVVTGVDHEVGLEVGQGARASAS